MTRSLRRLSMVAVFALILAAISATVFASSSLCYQEPEIGSNSYQWNRFGHCRDTYLTVVGNQLMSVRKDGDSLGIVYYDANYNPVHGKNKFVPLELPLFGAFYADGTNYYVLTGQMNPDESDETEVFRVTKYDLNWNRVSSASLYGENTYIPFDAGNAEITSINGYLIIRTCHEMYASSDGKHHQANVTLTLKLSTMEFTNACTGVWNNGYGYASHSFHQRVIADEGKIVAVDLGDAHPRGLVLFTYPEGFETMSGWVKTNSTLLLIAPGETGNNDTGYAIGGLKASSDHYLVAGNCIDLAADPVDLFGQRDVFVATCAKSDITDKVRRVFSDRRDGEGTALVPQFTKLSDDRFLLLWSYENSSDVCYTVIDKDGNKVSPYYRIQGKLNDCEPVLFNGKVVWISSEGIMIKNGEVGEDVTFYSINAADPSKSSMKVVRREHKLTESHSLDAAAGIVTVHRTCSQCGLAETYSFPVPTNLEYEYWYNTNKNRDLFSAVNGHELDESVNDYHNLLIVFEDWDPKYYDIVCLDDGVTEYSGRYYPRPTDEHPNLAYVEVELKNAGTAQISIRPKYIENRDFDYLISFTVYHKISEDETTYEWSDDYSTCTAKAICSAYPEHVVEETVQSQIYKTTATCFEPGVTTYAAYFSRESGIRSAKIEAESPALGHDYYCYAWNWLGSGYCRAYIMCLRCEDIQTIDADITEAVITPATCEEDGSALYTATVVLEGKTFTNEKTFALKATGHQYELDRFIWSDDLSTAKARFVCAHDNAHTEEIDAEVQRTVSGATCTEPGSVRSTATVKLDGKTYTDEQTKETEPAKGHSYGSPSWSWAADYSTCKATFTCKNDASHKEVKTASITVTEVPAGCETAGTTTYTASVKFNGKTYRNTKTVTVSATGHQFALDQFVWSDDLSSAQAHFICGHDSTHTKDVAATVKRTVTEPTCTKPGSVSSTATAKFEGKTYTDKKTKPSSPATGHHYGDPSWNWSGDLSSATAVFVCSKGDDRQELDALITVNTIGEETEYLAKVTFLGTEYSDRKVVSNSATLTLSDTSIRIPLGSPYQLSAVSNRELEWTVDDEKVLTVDQSGKISPEYPGHAVVTVHAKQSALTVSCDVTVEFADVRNQKDFFYSPVYWAVEREITSGYTDSHGNLTGKFGPGDPCSRAQIVTFLWRANGKPDVGAASAPKFRDVKSTAYYYKAVLWAASEGITTGYSDKNGKPSGKFGPDDHCTRAQIVTFLWRAAGSPAVDPSEAQSFKDVKKTDYFYNPVIWASGKGITTGYTDKNGNPTGYFGSNDTCTRGQVVTFLYRAEN